MSKLRHANYIQINESKINSLKSERKKKERAKTSPGGHSTEHDDPGQVSKAGQEVIAGVGSVAITLQVCVRRGLVLAYERLGAGLSCVSGLVKGPKNDKHQLVNSLIWECYACLQLNQYMLACYLCFFM